MSQYGVKINNYAAGSIAEVSQGVRDFYDITPAMLTNSLFLDFLRDNGLKVSKNDFSRDVICIDFNYGSASYDKAYAKFKKQVIQNRINRKSATTKSQIDKANRTKAWLQKKYKHLQENSDLYVEQSRKQLREQFYVNGVDIRYPKFDRNKKIVGYDTIHYKMLYRTPGKAKAGKCMFIRKSLYKKAHDFLWMGIKLPKKNAPIVEIGAYSSLITSTIEDRVKIEPENILVVKDVDSFFTTNVLSVETDENRNCYVEKKENYQVKNTMFDGQGLIDSSIFPAWANGYILLRQHFCKMAAFKTHIQKFFKDYYGSKYETATVEDMWGNKHYVKDIKIITTENSMKWCKFPVTYDRWCEKVWDNGALFGIVKTAHRSKYGDKQRMSYQMVNALNIDTIDNVVKETKEYVHLLKTDDKVYFDFLRRTANFCNDNEVLLALCEQIPEFVNSSYFVERRNANIAAYVKDIKTGHILQNGDNLVVVGSPYAMLLHAVGEDALADPTFVQETDCIQCYTKRFDSNNYLAFFRSPYNSQNNMLYLHNISHPLLDKYFDLGEQIIAINMNHTDAQDRGNGMDTDSDSGFVTNQSDIVDHAKYCYKRYPTIVNNIPKEKNIYTNDLINYAIIDNNLSAAQMDIGESSNVAQIGLSYTYNKFGADYEHYIAALAVIAQAAIDNCKRKFDIDIHSEIQRIKKEMNIDEMGIPMFFAGVNPQKRNKVNPNIQCPMNCVYRMKNKQISNRDVIPIGDFFVKHKNTETYKTSRKVEGFIEKYITELTRYEIQQEHTTEEYLLLRADYDELIHDLRGITISGKYVGLMSWLIDKAFLITTDMKKHSGQIQTKLNKNRSVLLKTLYDLNPKSFKKCFKMGNGK